MTGEVPHRRPPRAERERRRARRASPRLDGRFADGGTGHPVLFSMRPALELGTFPDGGGYPVGFVEAAAAAMGCDDLRQIVHLCAGSVHGGLITIDARAEVLPDGHKYRTEGMRPDVCADVRWLPLGPDTVRWVLVDPPYDQDYAAALYGTADIYPTPMVLLREVAAALVPGGRVGFLHHLVPSLPDGLRQVAVYGVATGPGYRIRAFTVAERIVDADQLDGLT